MEVMGEEGWETEIIQPYRTSEIRHRKGLVGHRSKKASVFWLPDLICQRSCVTRGISNLLIEKWKENI